MAYAKSFKELKVYMLSRNLSSRIFVLTKTFPKEEKYSMIDQVRRSSRSIGAQIAEAWAKRRYEKHFISKLTDADGEQMETQHWIETAMDCAYLPETIGKELLYEFEKVGKMIQGMIDKSSDFCDPPNSD